MEKTSPPPLISPSWPIWRSGQVRKGAQGFGCSEVFTRHDFYRCKKVLLVVIFIFCTEIIVPNIMVNTETSRGKTEWHLDLYKCTHSTQANTLLHSHHLLMQSDRLNECRVKISTGNQLSPVWFLQSRWWLGEIEKKGDKGGRESSERWGGNGVRRLWHRPLWSFKCTKWS